MRVRHFNRAEMPVRRYSDGSRTTYPRRSVAVTAARGGRRYDPDARAELADARPAVIAYATPEAVSALRARMTAMGITADSPDRL